MRGPPGLFAFADHRSPPPCPDGRKKAMLICSERNAPETSSCGGPMSEAPQEFHKAGVHWRQRNGCWRLRRSWPKHVTLEGSFFCLAWAFVGILFALGLVSFFAHFNTIQVGPTTLAQAPLLVKTLVAACVVGALLSVALFGLAVPMLGVMINIAGFIPLVVDFPADRLRRGWKEVGPLSEISHLYGHCEEGGATYYVVFNNGRPAWPL